MAGLLRSAVYITLALPVLFAVLHTIIRIVRHFYKFPIPEYLVDLIDNPVRRRVQPPDETAVRHGIEPGMTVLEVGPGSGTYTMASARRVGKNGKLVTIDIEPKMIERVRRRAEAEGITNLEAKVTDVCDLPFDNGVFDLIYMIAVIGEIPEPDRAIKEFYRVLSSAGTLVFSELLVDPDYPLASALVRRVTAAGFRLQRRIGSLFYYTLIFEKG